MSNRRSYAAVLRDIAQECRRELTDTIAIDVAERGYSEGAREELNLRVRACEAGAALVEAWTAAPESTETGQKMAPAHRAESGNY